MMSVSRDIKSRFGKGMAILLSMLFLISGTGFSYSAHFCGDELKSWALFGETSGCDMPVLTEKKCPVHEEMILVVPNNCCDNDKISVDRVEHEASLITTETHADFVIPEKFGASIPFPITAKACFSSHLERPPPINRDIFILVQSFLL
jgi:hypothetical protein